jgi:hypothetical protein
MAGDCLVLSLLNQPGNRLSLWIELQSQQR